MPRTKTTKAPVSSKAKAQPKAKVEPKVEPKTDLNALEKKVKAMPDGPTKKAMLKDIELKKKTIVQK